MPRWLSHLLLLFSLYFVPSSGWILPSCACGRFAPLLYMYSAMSAHAAEFAKGTANHTTALPAARELAVHYPYGLDNIGKIFVYHHELGRRECPQGHGCAD